MSDVAQRLAVVTGGNRGIGLEVCRQLAQQGYRVLLTARDAEQARQAAAGLGSAGSVRAEQLDVTSEASIQAFAERLRAERAAIFALVNNAGISMKGFNADVVRGTLAVNFFGALHVTQALAPLVVDGGNIVMVSSGMGELSAYSPALKARFLDETLSVGGLIALADEFAAEVAAGQHEAHGWPSSAYRVSKASLNALTRILARETTRLRINSVCPGWVKTDMGGAGASRTVETGACGIVWAATLGKGGPHGGFFRDGKPIAW
ncbi:MAG TPA: SDR family NAD(P)-dependent oxidoreductase [Polyangiaceae bacterium]|nr:SDR family NAD(P)-dependent oxidoreductase [Polyangiaceae bacterium]